MEKAKKYYAFISYKREDKDSAKWLQHKLEHYKLPSNLNGRSDLPSEIRPIFLDTSELNPGNLPQQIHDALEASRYLIVICSPRSAKSEWVNKEVETFIAMGKKDYIIPFIIDGKPHAENPDEECFPPAILNLPKEHELLGANPTEMGRDAAAVKTVAQMFGLRFDTLWKRYEREQKRKRALIFIAIALFVLAVLGIAAYIWRQNIEITKSKTELQTAYNNLSEANQKIVQQNVEITKSKENLQTAYNDLSEANQKIVQQNVEITKSKENLQTAYDEIKKKQADLQTANKNLFDAKQDVEKERDRAEQANITLRLTNNAKSLAQSRAAAEAAIRLNEKGDSYTARKIAIEALDLAYTPQGESALRYACMYDNAILKGHNAYVNSATFSPDGRKILSASWDNTIRIWDANTGQCIDTLIGHTSSVKSAVFSPDGKFIASASWDNTIRIWDANTGDCVGKPLIEHTDNVNSVAFSPDGKILASASDDKTIRIWDANTWKCTNTLIGHTSSVESVAFSPDGKFIASASWDNTIRIWNTNNGECIGKPLIGHKDLIHSVVFSPNGELIVSASNDETIRIWNVKTRTSRKIKGLTEGGLLSASFSPDGKYVVSGSSDGYVYLWDIDGNLIHYPASDNAISSVLFSPDGEKILLASCDNTIRIIVCFKQSINNQLKNVKYVTETATSPDGKHFASASNDDWSINITNVSTGESICKPLKGHAEIISSIAYSPDGKLLLSASWDNTVRIWDANNGDLLKILNHNFFVWSADFSPDGKYIVSASDDIYIWDTKSGNKIQTFVENRKNLNASIRSAAFSPDGKYIVTTLNQYSAYNIYDFPSFQDLIKETRERFKDYPLTPEERKKYYLE